jgi:hypothetical protein
MTPPVEQQQCQCAVLGAPEARGRGKHGQQHLQFQDCLSMTSNGTEEAI